MGVVYLKGNHPFKVKHIMNGIPKVGQTRRGLPWELLLYSLRIWIKLRRRLTKKRRRCDIEQPRAKALGVVAAVMPALSAAGAI